MVPLGSLEDFFMNRRSFFCSLLGLAAVAALPTAKAEAAQPMLDPAIEPNGDDLADLPAADAADAQYYRRRRVVYRRRPVYRRRVVVYRRPVVYRRRRVYYSRPVIYRRRRW